jgi:hypothetical protein
MGCRERELLIVRTRTSRFKKNAEIATLGLVLASGGCNELIGLTGYTASADAGVAETGTVEHPDGGAAVAEASCGDDAAGSCYACTPVTNVQFLNACTNAACVPFDDGRLTNLLPDGALPPLPAVPGDGGGH